MALISCPDCKREISTEALSCPHCGRPKDPEKINVYCKHCGKENSNLDSTCTRCGRSLAQAQRLEEVKHNKREISWKGVLIAAVAITVMLIISSLSKKPDSDTSEQKQKKIETPSSPDLEATMHFTGTQFVFRNKDLFSWNNCTLRLAFSGMLTN